MKSALETPHLNTKRKRLNKKNLSLCKACLFLHLRVVHVSETKTKALVAPKTPCLLEFIAQDLTLQAETVKFNLKPKLVVFK